MDIGKLLTSKTALSIWQILLELFAQRVAQLEAHHAANDQPTSE